jgi:hypothetical protein
MTATYEREIVPIPITKASLVTGNGARMTAAASDSGTRFVLDLLPNGRPSDRPYLWNAEGLRELSDFALTLAKDLESQS